ncbi:MAG: outer-membrane lipoprotein carrier protein LolA [Candidatus Saccharibacteria bacterium]|nr:outer-membrane lipoprotein carrier protein LolA [Pseudorhodobacter sp.]
MKKRIALLAPFVALILSLPLQAKEVPLDVLSGYLNSLTTFQASFVQVNADGSKSKGQIYVQRPGRARFEYTAPDKNLVIAAAGQVVIFDAKSNEPPEQYPLSRTPLNLILAQSVNLATAKMVVGHGEVGGMTIVRAQDPKHPDYGTIDLVFSPNPVALTKWIITDDIGNQTSVTLGGLEVGKSFGASLFSMEVEMAKRGR